MPMTVLHHRKITVEQPAAEGQTNAREPLADARSLRSCPGASATLRLTNTGYHDVLLPDESFFGAIIGDARFLPVGTITGDMGGLPAGCAD